MYTKIKFSFIFFLSFILMTAIGQRRNINAVSQDCESNFGTVYTYRNYELQDLFSGEKSWNFSSIYFQPSSQAFSDFHIDNFTLDGGKVAIVLPKDINRLYIRNLELKNGATLIITSHQDGTEFKGDNNHTRKHIATVSDIHIHDSSKLIMLLNDDTDTSQNGTENSGNKDIYIQGFNLVEADSDWRLYTNMLFRVSGGLGSNAELHVGRIGNGAVPDRSMVQLATDSQAVFEFAKINTYSLARFRSASRHTSGFVGTHGRANPPNSDLMADPLWQNSYRWRAFSADEINVKHDTSTPTIFDILEVNVGPVTVGLGIGLLDIRGNIFNTNQDQLYFSPWICPGQSIDWDYDMYDYHFNQFENNVPGPNAKINIYANSVFYDQSGQLKDEYKVSKETLKKSKIEYGKNQHNWSSIIRPNPVEHDLEISMDIPKVELARLSIWDTSGKKVHGEFKTDLAKGHLSWKINDLGKLIPGTYYIRILMDKEYLDPIKFVKL